MTLGRHTATVGESSELVAALQVRAWLHDGSLVARVTRTADLAATIPVTVVVTSRHALHDEVDRWLHEMGYVDGAASGEAGQPWT